MSLFQKKTVTLTWGCQAENHVGMEKIGNGLSDFGFSSENLENVKIVFEAKGFDTNLYNLIKLDWDKKYWDTRRQKVLNKHARYNLVFGEFNQKADFENKKGTIYDINDINEIKGLKKIKNELGNYFGEEFKNLECEGNYYYDINKCGIGYHGDAERKKVVGMRFGESCDLHYWWYYNSKRIKKRISIPLEHGDIYIMNFKATGNDWKKKNIYTLRHATGCEKYIK